MEVDGWLPLLPEIYLPALTEMLDVVRRKGATAGNFCHNVRNVHRFFSSHRRTNTEYHVACVFKSQQNQKPKSAS